MNKNNEELNDLCSGLFNTFFALGEIIGPLVGNELYAEYGFETTCTTFGVTFIAFGLIYFLVWDRCFRSQEKIIININKELLIP